MSQQDDCAAAHPKTAGATVPAVTDKSDPPRVSTRIIGPQFAPVSEINMTNEEVLAALQYLIGTLYTPSIKETITELTGRRRVVGPNDRSTRDFDRNRVRIIADASGSIEAFRFN